MKQPAASPGRAEKQQQLPAPPGLARLLLSKSRRGARSRRAPATSPMFVASRGRSSRAPAGEPSSPKVTCIGQVRMRKGKGKGNGKKKGAAAAPQVRASTQEKARGYCRCLKKAFLCGGLFGFDRSARKHKAPSPVAERTRRSPWVFSSRDVAVAAAPKAPDPPRSERAEEEEEEMGVGVGVFCSVEPDEAEEPVAPKEQEHEEEEAELVSSATATPPKNALLLMRCRSAPQNRCSPLTARFASAPSPVQVAVEIASTASARASPSPRKPEMVAVEREASPPARPSPSPRKPEMVAVEREHDEKWQEMAAIAAQEQQREDARAAEQEEEDDDYDEDEEAEELRCSSARPLVLPRCKSEPATTAAAKMAAGMGAEAASSGCFWAHGGSGRRRHAPPLSPVSAAPMALAGH